MSTLGRTIVVTGELRASENITLEGRIDGPIWCEGHAVTLSPDSEVTGDVIARDITVMGRVTGQLIATDVVDVRPMAVVSGKVLSRRFILHEGADFKGRVEPQHLEAAIGVARFHQQKRDAARG
jgi:cytoskeletal protein CcmA (bactofilin family)